MAAIWKYFRISDDDKSIDDCQLYSAKLEDSTKTCWPAYCMLRTGYQTELSTCHTFFQSKSESANSMKWVNSIIHNQCWREHKGVIGTYIGSEKSIIGAFHID